MILIFNCCLKSIFIYGVETFREMLQMVLQYVKINVKVHTSLTYKKRKKKRKIRAIMVRIIKYQWISAPRSKIVN